jgi:hypothetical protein
MNVNLRNFGMWVVIVVLLLAAFAFFLTPHTMLRNGSDQGREHVVIDQRPEIHNRLSSGQPTTSHETSLSQPLTEVGRNNMDEVLVQKPEIYDSYSEGHTAATSQDISFSQLLTEVDQNHVRDVVIQGPEIHGTFTNGSSFQTYAPNDPTLVSRLYNGKVSITAKPPGDNVPWFVSLLVSWLPFIALIEVWIFLSRQMQGGAGKAMGFGKSRAKMLTEAHGRSRTSPASMRPSRSFRRSSSSCAIPANINGSADGFRAAFCWSAPPAPARR